jgi:hypothetical protein
MSYEGSLNDLNIVLLEQDYKTLRFPEFYKDSEDRPGIYRSEDATLGHYKTNSGQSNKWCTIDYLDHLMPQPTSELENIFWEWILERALLHQGLAPYGIVRDELEIISQVQKDKKVLERLSAYGPVVEAIWSKANYAQVSKGELVVRPAAYYFDSIGIDAFFLFRNINKLDEACINIFPVDFCNTQPDSFIANNKRRNHFINHPEPHHLGLVDQSGNRIRKNIFRHPTTPIFSPFTAKHLFSILSVDSHQLIPRILRVLKDIQPGKINQRAIKTYNYPPYTNAVIGAIKEYIG